MRRIGIGMDEADADDVDAGGAEVARGGAHAVLVQRTQLLAEEVEPAADFADMAQRHDALGLHPEIRIAVALGHGLAGDFEDMAEARGDDQAEAFDLALQQRVGRDRGAVRQHAEIVDACVPFAEDGVNAAHQRDGGI